MGGALTGEVLLVTEDTLLAEEDTADRTAILAKVFSRFAFRMAMGSTIGLSIAWNLYANFLKEMLYYFIKHVFFYHRAIKGGLFKMEGEQTESRFISFYVYYFIIFKKREIEKKSL